MSVVVVATITPLPEHRDEVIAAFTATIPQLHAEDSKGAALTALNPQLAGKVSGAPEVIVLDAVPAGDAAKGQL